jgi:hypothetical protein
LNYADTIAGRLGVDTKPFSDGMNTAARDGKRAGDKIAEGMNRADAAHGSLLKSSARVGHQISNVARQMTSGADAADILSTSLEAIGRSMKLGLGAISALFVGGLLIGEIAKAAKAAEKLHAEIMGLVAAGPDARFETLDKLISKLEEVRKKSAELKSQGVLGMIGSAIKETFTGKTVVAEGAGLVEQPGQVNPANALARERLRLGRGIADKAKRANNEQAARDGGDPSKADRMKAMDDMLPKVRAAFMDKNMALVAEELRGYANTIKEINKKEQEHLAKIDQDKADAAANRQRSIKESMQLSLGDLAKNGRDRAPGDDSHWGAGRAAREAMKEEALARKEMLAEHPEEALRHHNRAEDIKQGIGTLKDSEKDMASAVQRGNDASEVLRAIMANTGRGLVNK